MKTPKLTPADMEVERRFALARSRSRKRFESIDAEVQRQVAATLEQRRVPTKTERIEALETEVRDLRDRIAKLEAIIVDMPHYRSGT